MTGFLESLDNSKAADAKDRKKWFSLHGGGAWTKNTRSGRTETVVIKLHLVFGVIMETVLKNLTGKRFNQVPSKDVACKILKEANFIAKSQIVQELLDGKDSVSGNCLS